MTLPIARAPSGHNGPAHGLSDDRQETKIIRSPEWQTTEPRVLRQRNLTGSRGEVPLAAQAHQPPPPPHPRTQLHFQVLVTQTGAWIDIEDVLTIGKLGTGQEAYYLDSVAGGIEDYYAGEGEAPGRWVGSGCGDLNLAGEVQPAKLRRILAAEHPDSGVELAGRRGGLRVPGFDLTFSAPKSVSLLWALGDPETRRVVRECHERAVDAAFGYIEREAARVRRGLGGAQSYRAEGLIGAAFRHRSSRAGDPQLHTHVLIANLAKGPDRRYSALDGTRIYRHAKSGGYLYQAQLRHDLSCELGISFQPVRRGAAEIEGVPDHVLRGFSRRRVEIERALAERGAHTRQAARVAAVASRRAKEYGVSGDTLHDRWRERARELDFDPGGWSPGRSEQLDEPYRDLRDLALAVTAERSHFDRRDAIQAICQRAPQGISVGRAEEIADAFLASGEVTRIADSPFGPRYSTPDILALERGILSATTKLRRSGRGKVHSEVVEKVLGRRPTIGPDQAEMVRALATQGNGVAIVVGRPGTGKTFALNAAAEAWSAAGFVVRGAAPTRVAAAELEAAAGIPSVSLSALLAELDDRAANEHGMSALQQGTVLVVDEAAMVGTRSIARLLDHVDAAKGKLVLVGDHRQLRELEAGGLFAALAEREPTIELREVRRHEHALDREGVERIRQGRGGESFELYRAEGRVVIATDSDGRRDAMVGDWWDACREGSDAVMIAKRNSDVAELNARARELMRASGALGAREIEVGGQPFSAGDVVVTRVNSTTHGVANRMRWQVSKVHADGTIEVDRLADGTCATLDRNYLEQVNPQNGAPALQHGYAGTIYMAQGQSVDQAFVAAEAAMSLEEFNTALSRSSGETYVYAVAAPEAERDEYAPRLPARCDPLDELVESIERPEAQLAAIEEARRAPLRELPASELVERREELRRELGGERASLAPESGTHHAGAPGRAQDPELHPQLAAVEAELAERRRLAVAASRLAPPAYVREAIGARPDSPRDRLRWEQALQEIERYRQTHGVNDSRRALGAEPRPGLQRAAFERARNRIARAQRELGRSELSRDLTPGLEISV